MNPPHLFIKFVFSSLLREASISSLTSLKFLSKLVMAGSNLITSSLFSSPDKQLKYFGKIMIIKDNQQRGCKQNTTVDLSIVRLTRSGLVVMLNNINDTKRVFPVIERN